MKTKFLIGDTVEVDCFEYGKKICGIVANIEFRNNRLTAQTPKSELIYKIIDISTNREYWRWTDELSLISKEFFLQYMLER